MNNRETGCLLSPNDLRDYKINMASRIELPKEYKIPSTHIKDQGNVGSCVAHALSSMLEKYNEIFSTGWIYGYRPNDYHQGRGMYPREALKTIQKIGAVKQIDFPYNIEMNKAKEEVNKKLDKLKSLAEEFKIKSYAKLYSNREIKEFLYTSNCPIPFCILVDDLELDENNIIQIPISKDLGGHMMLIIGWNETGFIIQNSWGKDWGDNGCAILPYEYSIEEAWGVVLDENSNQITKKPFLYKIREILQKIFNLLFR